MPCVVAAGLGLSRLVVIGRDVAQLVAALRGTSIVIPGKQYAGKKLAVVMLVEPCAFDVKQLDAAQMGKCKRINCELRNRPVTARVRFVIENVDRTISDLKKIDVSRNWCVIAGCTKLNAILRIYFFDVGGGKPNRDLDCERHRIIGEHEALQGFVAAYVVADCRQNKGRGARREIVPFDNERFGRMECINMQLRCASAVLK